MSKPSKRLKVWGDLSTIFGIVFLILAFFMFVFDDSSSSYAFISGIVWLILSPVLKGFSVVVEHAEKQLEIWDEVESSNAMED